MQTLPKLGFQFDAHLLLRIGAAFAFLYPAVAATIDPTSWLAYFPPTIRAFPIPPMVLLHTFGALEVVLALWVLSGWHIRFPALVMTVMLVVIVVTNLPQRDVLFRDLSIAMMTLALVILPTPEPRAKGLAH